MFSLPFPIARVTFLECVRQPVYFVIVALCAVLMVITTAATGFTMGYTESGDVSGDDKLLVDLGLATVFALSVLLAGFIATAALSKEIENKTVLTIVSKPVPRPVLIIGKWLGVTGAMLVATASMLLMMLIAVQHGVLMNAVDKVHLPVVTFGLGSVVLALLTGAWGSFFYGWSFPQVATLALAPLLALAFLGVVLFKRDFTIQEWHAGFKPQVFTAAACLLLSIPVLTSIAVAASARLGQVMTIVVCFGVFMLGLLSAGIFGARAFTNQPIAQVAVARPFDNNKRFETLANPGDMYIVVADSGFATTPKVGDPLYYSASPNGVDRAVPPFDPPARALATSDEALRPGTPPALVITAVKDRDITIRHIGGTALPVQRPPRTGDYLFLTPTKANPWAVAAWGVVPNLQFFWLVDAVNQNQPVPTSHLALMALYALSQITVFLSVAVLLFQRRDVG
jgi:ABC-2 type transport system permease protein